MELDFSPEDEELRNGVRTVLERECPMSLVRRHVEAVVQNEPSSVPSDLWKLFVSLDWPALTIEEAHGGIGLGAVELAVLAEELGRANAPGALLSTVAGFVPVVRNAGGDAALQWLRAVASGQISATVALDAEGAVDGCAVTAAARYVVGVLEADEVAFVVGDTVAIVERERLDVTLLHSADPSRSLAHVRADRIEVAADRILPIERDALAHAVEEQTLATAFECVGACQAIFDTNLQYAKERVQFGVPIGSFQAVKHKLANMYVALERARAVCIFAAATVAEDDPRRAVAVSMAKAAAGDCQQLVVADGIQLLGGIGYTWEHDQQIRVKRARAVAVLNGDAAAHRRRIADSLGI